MSNIGKMKMAVNTSYPYAWDDSLSVYEFLGKVVTKLNEVVTLVNLKIPDDFDDRYADMLRTYTEDELMNLLENGLLETFFTEFSETIEAVGADFSETVEAIGEDFQLDFDTLTGLFSGLQTQFDNVVANVTVDSEVILARGTKPTLGERLDSTEATLGARLDSTDAQVEDIIEYSTNLFDINKAVTGKVIASNGSIVDNAEYAYSDFIAVDPGTPYSTKATYSFAEYSGNLQFLRRQDTMPQGATFTISPDAAYIRINIQPSVTNNGSPRLNLGSAILPYEPYFTRLNKVAVDGEKILNESLPSSKIKGQISLSKRTPIGNKASIICTGSLPNIVTPDKTLTIPSGTIILTGNKSYAVALETILSFTTQHSYVYFDTDTGEFILLKEVSRLNTLPETAIYIGTVSFGGLESNTIRSVDLPCDYTINGVVASRFKDVIPNAQVEKIFHTEVIPASWYEAPIVDGYDAANHYVDEITLDDIYDVYDDIVINNSGWATKTEQGLDSSGTYPVYEYEFKPENVESALFTKPKPKIIIFTGTHGEEKSSVISLRNFMRDVANNWENDKLLEFVRFNVHLIIKPIVNPWGFVNFKRKNSNGVDINRNCSGRWNTSKSSNPDSQEYKGAAPFSEAEAQYIRSTVENNLDAIACYDYHMNGSSGDVYDTLFWHLIEDYREEEGFSQVNVISKNNISKLTRESQKRYDIPDNSGFIGYISYNDSLSTVAAYAYSKGIPAATLECTRRIVGEEPVYSAKAIQLCTEFIGNAILNTVREFLN